MKRSLSFFYVLIILWALPAAGQDGLLGTWEGIEEGVVGLGSFEEDGTFYRETLEGETIFRAIFAEDNFCQFDFKMRFDDAEFILGLFFTPDETRLWNVATAVDSTIDLGTWRQRMIDALSSPHGYSMTFAWMGSYSTEGNSLRMDLNEVDLYLGDTEAVEFFINFFAEVLGSDELPDDLVEAITSEFGGTPVRGSTIAAAFSSDSVNLSFPYPDGSVDTFELTRISSPTAVTPISWGDLKSGW